MQTFIALLVAFAVVMGLAWMALVLVAARFVARRSQAAGGLGPWPTIGSALGLLAFGVGVAKAWDARTWHEALRERSTPIVGSLANGAICRACRWHGYVDARDGMILAVLVGAAVAALFFLPSFVIRVRARASLPADRRALLGAEVGLAVAALGVAAWVVAPPAYAPWWARDDVRWGLLEAEELTDRGAAGASCAVFRDAVRDHRATPLGGASRLPTGIPVEAEIARLADRCLSLPLGDREELPPTFFASVAWTAASLPARDAWLARAAAADPCAFLASAAGQCEAVPRDRAGWRKRGSTCLTTRGCYPFTGSSTFAKVLTLGLGGDGDARCAKQAGYLRGLASDDPEVTPWIDCPRP